jgi:hypothetical protein
MSVCFVFAGIACVCLGAGPGVSVDGGSSEDGHAYTWTVHNHAAQPITRIEFPHFNGDLPAEVRGWTLEMTEQVGISGGGPGLVPGRSETFGLRVAPAGAVEKISVARVCFADGTESQIGGVLCPMPESWFSRNVPMVGLAACGVLFLAIARLRRSRGRPDGQSPDNAAPAQPT